MATSVVEGVPGRKERFIRQVVWSCFAVCVNLFSGVLLAPFMIHRLGDEGYGVWALLFSFVDNFWLMDLGFRSASVKYSAHYRACGEPDKVNEVINTGLLYSSGVATVAILVSLFFSRYSVDVFKISASYRSVFILLIAMVGTTWGLGSLFNMFSSCLEGFQRFDLSNRIWIGTIALRSIGMVAVLSLGYRLQAMGIVVVISLGFNYLLTYFSLRSVFPELRLSRGLASMKMFRQMLDYGIHTFLATICLQVLNQSGPLLIGHFLPTAYVGYYLQPLRLVMYSADMVGRVGFVTASNAAEMAAKGEWALVERMALTVNRYCYILFAPVAVALTIYGKELYGVWIKPEYAAQSAPLLPVLAIAVTMAIAAQYNASSILYGLGKHKGYARSLAVEAILSAGLLYVVIPRYGILGAAWVTAILMVINRGFVTSWMLCRSLGSSLFLYLRGIYFRPTLVAIPTFLAGFWLKREWLHGNSWVQLIAGSAAIAILYYALAFTICLDATDRALPISWVRSRLKLK